MNKLKDKKCTVVRVQEIENELGEIEHGEQPVKGLENIWCYYENLAGKILSNRIVPEQEESNMFIINYTEDIELTDYILYKGKKYYITRIDDGKGYKNDLIIYCTIRERRTHER